MENVKKFYSSRGRQTLLDSLVMLKGYNSDLKISGENYHIQTEDWGISNPFIVSQIFRQGAVVKLVKIPYTKVLPEGVLATKADIQTAMQAQHDSILDLVLSGQLNFK